MTAGEALQAAAMTALGAIEGLGVYEGPPLQAAHPYALAEAGPESDWSHKSGAGREVRLAVTIRDRGERPARLRALTAAAEAAMATLSAEAGEWRIVLLHFLRSRTVRVEAKAAGRQEWAAAIDYRALMLRTG